MPSVLYNKEIQKVPVKVWSDLTQVESHALDQLKNTASMPFVFKHVAAMPDVHLGKGATVGSVIATKGAVMPAAVGVDIGCGMLAVKINCNPEVIVENANKIRMAIESMIPVGPNGNTSTSKTVVSWKGWADWYSLNAIHFNKRSEKELMDKALLQMGSLGGGNHFIELCIDGELGNEECSAWIMLHSGSRNIGKSLAEVHISRAKDEMKKMFISLPDPDLAYYVQGTKEYEAYMHDLMWAQDYAATNRLEMLLRVVKAIMSVVDHKYFETPGLINFREVINCHHNYATMESHYGENVLLTRKGAISARKGQFGIIPGSMGTRSYIVAGLGNEESFCSCSHGAGRRMSRSEAKRRFTLEDLAEQTKGVDCRLNADVVDEIPGAYKDIDQVMEYQKDLVRIVATLKQFLCVKG